LDNQSASIVFEAPSSTGGAAITNYEYSTMGGQISSSWKARSPVATTSPLIITGLSYGTAYYFTLRAVNAAGFGEASSVVYKVNLAAPTNLVATSTNGGASIAFTPTPNPAATGSAITNYQYSINNGVWTARSPVSTTSPLSLTGLVNGTTYTVRLRAVNIAGEGMESVAVSVKPGTPPGAPTGLSATAGNASASIAFTAPASNGGATITNYEYSINNGSTWTARSPAATTSPLSLTGLVNGTTYSIKLRAVNAAGVSTESLAVSVVPCTITVKPTSGGTIAAAQTGMNPFNPAAFSSTAAASGHTGTLQYKWQSSTTSNSAGFSDIAGATTITYDAGPLTQTTWFRRLAKVDDCKSDWIGAAASNVLDVTVFNKPGAPTGLSATAGNASASIAFTAPTSNGGATITNYEYSTNNGTTWTARNPVATTSPLSLTGLVNGTTYSIKLRAVNVLGGGTESAVVTLTPRTVAGAPTGLVATPRNQSASIAFTAPANTGGAAITNYEYSINNGFTWTARSPAATTSPLSLTGLVNGTTYSIKLRAVNAAGGGLASMAVSVTPRLGTAALRLSTNPIPVGDGNDPVLIYPNPISGGSFFIQTSLGDSKDVILKISDMRGREVYRQVRPEMSAGRIRAVLPPRIANGTYVLELVTQGSSQIYRLQVAR
jgi:titin